MFTCSVFLLWLDKSVECLFKVDRLIARERARLKEEKKKELDEVERLIAKEREKMKKRLTKQMSEMPDDLTSEY